MKSNIKTVLKRYKALVDNFLRSYISKDTEIPETLRRAMEYSLMAGGKRIRPILCIVWSQIFGEVIENVLPFACGIELIHTYSLIHDDLPAMDDDDLRRGVPTNHKVFGEAIAILAGDALLTDSFYLMLSSNVHLDRVISALKEIIHAVGPRGMVGGQVMDMELTGTLKCNIDKLKKMHSLKTGVFIEACCTSGAYLAGASEKDISRARKYGKKIGLAFQIADDILDVIGDEQKIGKPVGSDQKQKKITYPSIVGLKKSKELGWDAVCKGIEALASYDGEHIVFLKELAKYIMERTE